VKEKDGAYVPDKFLTAADLGDEMEGAAFKTVLVDAATGRAAVPNGSLGFRYAESGKGKWNLDLEGIDPALSLLGAGGSHTVELLLPRFDVGQQDSEGGASIAAASRSCRSRRPAGSVWSPPSST
jgi:nitrate reductase alpha subunit